MVIEDHPEFEKWERILANEGLDPLEKRNRECTARLVNAVAADRIGASAYYSWLYSYAFEMGEGCFGQEDMLALVKKVANGKQLKLRPLLRDQRFTDAGMLRSDVRRALAGRVLYRLADGATEPVIAEELGVTRSYVNTLSLRARAEQRKRFKESRGKETY